MAEAKCSMILRRLCHAVPRMFFSRCLYYGWVGGWVGYNIIWHFVLIQHCSLCRHEVKRECRNSQVATIQPPCTHLSSLHMVGINSGEGMLTPCVCNGEYCHRVSQESHASTKTTHLLRLFSSGMHREPFPSGRLST